MAYLARTLCLCVRREAVHPGLLPRQMTTLLNKIRLSSPSEGSGIRHVGANGDSPRFPLFGAKCHW